MEWDDVIPVILALVSMIGLFGFIAARRKGGPKKVDELYRHLQDMGVKASPLEKGGDREKIWQKSSFGKKSEGAIEIKGKNFDAVNVISVSGQYGTNYYLDYLVKSVTETVRQDAKKTRMVKKKSPPLWGRVVDIEWRGDEQLAQRLNFDYQLKYKLLQTDPKTLKSSITIFPEPKRGFTRIRTDYRPPSPDFFEAIDAIAKHIKSWV